MTTNKLELTETVCNSVDRRMVMFFWLKAVVEPRHILRSKARLWLISKISIFELISHAVMFAKQFGLQIYRMNM